MSHNKHQYTITPGDFNYATAVNYDNRNYYNPPMTINVDNKLFILPCGTSDDIKLQRDGNLLFVVTENKGLDYIGMSVIDVSDNSVTSCYLNSNDINCKENACYGIFDKELDEQISILNYYLPY